MTTDHTPGPWLWCDDFEGLTSPTGYVIAHDSYDGMWLAYRPASEREANARLIAAAPDLLEALKALQRQVLQNNIRGDEWMDEALELTRAAIAKAKGV